MNKTSGQIAFEAFNNLSVPLDGYPKSTRDSWERAAQTVLESQWRSVDDPPEDQEEIVFVGGGNSKPSWSGFKNRNKDRTHWMPIPKMPPKSKEREMFEKWMKNNPKFFTNQEDMAWKVWQAARKTS